MHTFKKLKIEDKLIVVIVVSAFDQKLINFCITIFLNHLFKNQLLVGSAPISLLEIKREKAKYKSSLLETLLQQQYSYVDISTGTIIKPGSVSNEQVLETIEAPLPFE